VAVAAPKVASRGWSALAVPGIRLALAAPRVVAAPARGAVRFFTSSSARRAAAESAKDAAGESATGARGLLKAYDALLYSNPIKTKAATSFFLFGLGDILAQFAQNAMRKDGTPAAPFDWARLGRGCLFGLLVSGPANHYNFQFLQWLTVNTMKLSPTGLVMPAVKMFFDQFVYFAYFMCGGYHVFMNTLEGSPMDATIEKLKENFWPTMKANWAFWPFVQLVNFKFVPVAWQVNFVLTASLAWALYLSYAFQGEGEGKEKLAGALDVEEVVEVKSK